MEFEAICYILACLGPKLNSYWNLCGPVHYAGALSLLLQAISFGYEISFDQLNLNYQTSYGKL